MFVRRTAAVLTTVIVLGTGTASAALAASPSPSATPALPKGLYGSADPTYDGVWRQSLSLLALDTAGAKPGRGSVEWLVGQQCADGAFAAYRPDPAAKCGPKTQTDSNSTAAAVQALAALGGHDDVVGKAVGWLKNAQNKDGGWGYSPGGASDANSTSVVIGALVAAGEDPADVKGEDGSPYDALAALSVPCGEDGGGAFAYQPGKKGELTANDDATAAGVLGALGQGLAADGAKAGAAAKCADGDPLTPRDAAGNGAAYLAAALAEDGHLVSALPGAEDQPDHGNTADAVVALAAAGQKQAADGALAWLEKNSPGWAAKSGPAAYAQLILAAHATGTDPRAFGGTDLVAKLAASGPAAPSAAPSGKSAAAEEDKGDDDSAFGIWWYVGVFLVAGAGIGFLMSDRLRKKQS